MTTAISSPTDPDNLNPRQSNSAPKLLPFGALTITLLYVGLGILWVLVATAVLAFFPPRLLTLNLNRLLFLSVTAGLLYWLVRRYTAAIETSVTEAQESAARARIYFDAAAQGIARVNNEGRIVRVNPKLEEMFGYREAELLGEPVEMLVPERLRKRHRQHRDAYAAAPRSRPMGLGYDLVGQRKDGTEFPIEVGLSYSHSREGGLVIANVTDITERLALELEARRSETLSALGAVAAGVAHELSNPLAIISSRAELMLAAGDELALAPQVREDLQVVLRNAVRAGRVSRDLLRLARQRSAAREPLSLTNLIEGALLLLRDQLRRDGIALDTVVEPDLPPIRGERTALEQVLINLVLNARDAVSNGNGKIRIAAATLADNPRCVTLTVTDNGCGIAPEALPRVFDLLYTTKADGSGLGLWLSRRAIRDHGGTLEVSSELGRGTTFVATLPAASEPGAEKPRLTEED